MGKNDADKRKEHAEKIRGWLSSLNASQQEVADILGISRGTVTNWLDPNMGKSWPDSFQQDTLNEIFQARSSNLNCTICRCLSAMPHGTKQGLEYALLAASSVQRKR